MYIFHGAFSEFGMQLLCLLTRQGYMEQPDLTAKRFHSAQCLALRCSRGGVLKICPFLDELKEELMFLIQSYGLPCRSPA